MKKQLTMGRIARYALCLAAACLLVAGVTFARYVQEIQGQGTGSVAAVAFDLSAGSGMNDVTSKLQGMKPTDSRAIEFSVSNAKDSVVSEVAQEYSVSVETTGNLPLEFSLAAKDGGSPEGYATKAGGTTGATGPTWTGGVLSAGAATATHTYTLTVTWPSGKADAALADEIDRVVLKVDALQAKPKQEAA